MNDAHDNARTDRGMLDKLTGKPGSGILNARVIRVLTNEVVTNYGKGVTHIRAIILEKPDGTRLELRLNVEPLEDELPAITANVIETR